MKTVDSSSHVRRSSSLGTIFLVVSPFLVFGSCTNEVAVYIARALLLFSFCLSLIVTSKARESLVVTFLLGGICAVGLIAAPLTAAGTWVAVLQLALIQRVVAVRRTVVLTRRIQSALFASICLAWMTALFISVGPGHAGGPDDFPGPFDNPNDAGLASLAIAMLSFAIARKAPRSVFRVAMWSTFAACSAAVLLSNSRTSWAGLFVFVLMYSFGVATRRRPRTYAAAVTVLLLAVPLVTVAMGLYSDRLPEKGTVQVGNKDIQSGRTTIWPVVIAKATERIAFGHGIGRSPGDELPEPYAGLSAHNGFLQILYQGGASALALYIGLLLWLFRRSVAIPDAHGRALSVAVLSAAVFCESLEVVLTQVHFGMGLVFWILSSTTLIRSQTHRDSLSASAPVPEPGIAVV